MCMMYLGELLSEDVFFEEGGEFVVEIIGDAGMGDGRSEGRSSLRL